MAELNARQIAFCHEFVVDRIATQAAIRAGYSARTARSQAARMMTKANITALIAELTAKVQADNLWSAREIADKLQSVAERCLVAEPVMERDSNGEMIETGEYKFEHSGANRALELLGKHRGMFTDKTEVSGPGGAPLDTVWTVNIVSPGDVVDK